MTSKCTLGRAKYQGSEGRGGGHHNQAGVADLVKGCFWGGHNLTATEGCLSATALCAAMPRSDRGEWAAARQDGGAPRGWRARG